MYCVKEKNTVDSVGHKKPVILIVDDDRVNTEMLDNILRQEGYNTIVARDGIDGLSLAKTMKPDLILLDILMPGIDGFEVCERLHQDDGTIDVPVILLSGMTGVHSKVKGLDSGAVDYITKPFDRNEVIARTKTHLARSLSSKASLAEKEQKLMQVRDAQQSLLVKPDSLPQAKFCVQYMPNCEAGGDFYDVISLGDDVYGYLVADVSGHDIGASFTTPALKAIFRQVARAEKDAVKVFEKVNNALKPILSNGQYLTACYAVLDRRKKKLQIVNAAHPPLLYVSKYSAPKTVTIEGDVLGNFDNVYFELTEFDVKEDDRILIYSDGLIERFAKGCKSRQDAMGKLLELSQNTKTLLLDKAIREIREEMSISLGPIEDDVVLMGVQV